MCFVVKFFSLNFVTRHSLVRAKGEVFVLLYVCYPPFASRAKGEVFGLLYVCLFVRLFVCSSTISRQPAGRFTPKFACRRTLVPDVSSPLLGVGPPGGRKKGQMKFSLLWESKGNFCILAVFERYLSNACTDPH